MKTATIKKIFNDIYKYPNPIFCFPVLYFQHKNFICEVAAAHRNLLGWARWNNSPFQNKNPLWIFEALFIDDGLWCTVLERKENRFIKRPDLNNHINSKEELNRFIWNLK